MADALKLPPADNYGPSPDGEHGTRYYTEATVSRLLAECRRMALEEAARVCENENVAPSDDPVGVAHCISLAIRALKD